MAAGIDRLEIEIQTQASAANKQLDLLARKLDKVGASIGGISVGNLGKIDGNIGTATHKVNGASSAFKKLNNVMGSYTATARNVDMRTKSLASTFGLFYANCFLLIRGMKSLGRASQKSMDYIETFNYYSVTMDKIGKEFGSHFEKYGYESADAYADSFSSRLKGLTTKMSGFNVGEDGVMSFADNKNLSLDPQAIVNYQASISAITNSVGLIGENSVNASKALTMLAADMSSLKNVDLATVMTNFQSGIIGQSRALYKYGIDITNATLQTYAYKHGVNMAVSEMTQADKMQLRILAILDQSKVAWGDQANTISSVANQYRILKQQVSNVARMIGNLLMPVLQVVLPFINGLLIALQKLIFFVGKLMGIDYSKIMDGISGGYGGGDESLGDLVDDADNVGDSLGLADKSAKKLQRTLLGFDQINKLNDNSDSDKGASGGGAGSSGGVDLSGAIGDMLADYESVWEKALKDSENKAQAWADRIVAIFNNMWRMIKTGDFEGVGEYISNGIVHVLDSIPWNSVYSVVKNFGMRFAEFLNGLISPELFGSVGKTIASALNTAIYTALSFSSAFDWVNFGLSIASGINTFFETFDFAALAQSINKWVKGIFTTLTTAIANVDWLTVYDGIVKFLGNLDIGTIGIIIGALAIKGIGKAVIGGTVLKTLATAFSSLSVWFSGGLVEGVGLFSKLGDMIALATTGTTTLHELFTVTFGTVGTAIAGISSIIGGVALAVTNFFSMWKDGFSWLKEALMLLGTALVAVGAVILGVAATPAAIVAAVVAAVATAAIVIHDNWDAICKWFSELPEWFNTKVITPVSNFFQGLWEKVSGFFSGARDNMVSIWSTVATWFNDCVIAPIAGFFNGLFERIKQIFEGLWIIVQAVWSVVSSWFNEYVIAPVVGFFKGLWESVSGFFSRLWEDIKIVWGVVASWFNSTIVMPISNLFSTLKDSISNFLRMAWDSIKGVWSAASSWFRDNIANPIGGVFDSVKTAITNAFSSAWTAVKSGAVGAMNAVVGGIESAINFIVRGINSIIGGFNKIVSWAAKVAEVSWGGVDLVKEVRLSRISMYAGGGFPSMGEVFIAREKGPEMVGSMNGRTAVANNDQIVTGISAGVKQAVAEAMMEVMMMSGGQQGGQQVIVTLEGDAGQIFKVVKTEAKKYERNYMEPAFG